MSTTQDHLSIADIRDDIILLKEGSAALVIKTSAVNFGLLSELEQVAIIDTFAQLLNSLSYSIQIVIRSKRLDITSYLTKLDKVQTNQTNPLLAQLIVKYRQFIQATIKENEVLDKQFYIAVPVSHLELGITYKKDWINKAKTTLNPRRDQLIRQLNRVGLKSEQLTTKELIKLFYEIYNPEEAPANPGPKVESIQLGTPKIPTPQPNTPPPVSNQYQTPLNQQPQTGYIQNQHVPQPPSQYNTPTPNNYPDPYQQPSRPKNHPFVVEELSG